MIKLLIGGSPCTYWSIQQTNATRETKACGIGWELFKNYLIAKEKFKPDFFLYENNQSAAQEIKDMIKHEFGVTDGFQMDMFTADTGARYIEIDSALVSAQKRKRFYVHNCGEVEQPKDRFIYLQDILECKISDSDESSKLKVKEATEKGFVEIKKGECVDLTQPKSKTRRGRKMAEKCNCLTTGNAFYQYCGTSDVIDKKYKKITIDGKHVLRMFTVTEYARLQTLPDDYCKYASDQQAFRAIGNGWTAEVIIHILNGALANVPKDEEIVVLSMYDGIATGRYCLDKMGFTNVKYYAYEIDKHAIKIAKGNYPDIIECGDAFKLREKDWHIGY